MHAYKLHHVHLQANDSIKTKGIFRPGPVESGHLYIYDYKSTDAAPPREIEFVDFEFASDFHSLGIAYDETTSRLLVASHRHDFPAVELFKLDLNLDKPTATHLLSIQHPLLHGPNAMVWINEHEFYATNDHHLLIRHHPFLSKLETALALPGGTVVHVDFASLLADPQGRAQASIVARVPFANGIDLLNETTAVVASTSRTRVYFYNITRPFSSPPIFKYLKSIKLPFLPDNLSISKDGALMMAGHPHPPSLDKFCKSRHICDNDADAQKSSELCATTVPAPSWVARWTEENGLENLYVDVEYPTSSTALWDPEGKIGIVTGLYAWGILVWRDV